LAEATREVNVDLIVGRNESAALAVAYGLDVRQSDVLESDAVGQAASRLAHGEGDLMAKIRLIAHLIKQLPGYRLRRGGARLINETRDVLGLPEALASSNQVFVVHGRPLRDHASVRIASVSSAVVCVADHLRDDVARAYPRATVEVIANASVDLEPQGPPLRSDPVDSVRLLWAGTLDANKAPLEALRIAEHVAKTGRRVRLTVVGPTADVEILRALQERGHRLRGVEFELRGPVDDMAPLLRDAHYVLITSHHEGLPRIGMEALSAGVPVAGYVSAGTKELLDDESLLAAWGEAEALAEAIDVSIPTWHLRASASRRRYLAAFTPRRQWNDYVGLFKRYDLWTEVSAP
jgi:glycosyltransferase involved in cell wall biosynthesis